ncbi:MAG TPA: hypothetical protein VJ599_00295 [Nitrososphaeraceae archaeon]|nr:hypothetical protein [Nitrososphaeraceae archaeon]
MFKDDVSDYNLMRRVYFSHSNGTEPSSTEDNFSTRRDGDNMVSKSTQPIRLSHLIAFNVKENDTVISGILTIEFEYYSSDGSIKYRDMRYTDPRLIKHIEGNPRVMKNIDSYLRKNLLEAEYGFKLMS